VPGALTEAWSTVLVIETDGFWVSRTTKSRMSLTGRRSWCQWRCPRCDVAAVEVSLSSRCRSRARDRGAGGEAGEIGGAIAAVDWTQAGLRIADDQAGDRQVAGFVTA